jgi:primosomal protein N' (replication factor Y) (superfamily II helicase)
MNSIARVAVHVPAVSGVFDYYLPDELASLVRAGSLVTVPFGKQVVQGIVSSLVGESPLPDLKFVLSLVDIQPVVTAAQLQLAQWMSAAYYAPLAECLQGMIPPGLGQHADSLFSLGENGAEPPDLTDLQKKVLALLKQRGPLRGRQLDAAFPRQNWRVSVKTLLNKALLHSVPVLPKPTVNRKLVRTAQINVSSNAIEMAMASLGRASSPALSRRQAILRFLLKEVMPVNVAWVYAQTGGNLADLHMLEEKDLVALGETEIWRDPLEGMQIETDSPPRLTDDQQAAWQLILPHLNDAVRATHSQPILLHGVTGSGKTELYLRAVAEVLQQGRQAIILVPEISLTPQTVRRFAARFPGQVGLIHSRLSAGERYDTWRRARNGQLSVVVGPRSALFTPFDRLGLIVVDECHDDSYYQGELPPLYHAVETAIACQRICASALLMGSATPAVEMVYRFRRQNWPLISLPRRILAHRDAVKKRLELLGQPQPGGVQTAGESALSLPLPLVSIVDMREELKGGNRSIFSRLLLRSLGEVLKAGQQAILFLNRRGQASYVFCRDCGYVARCPRCDLPLALHADTQKLVCHTCGYQREPFVKCPQCGNGHIREFGTGTEKVEELVRAEFPQANVLRWDADTTRMKGSEEILLSHFANHRADILIGTQMLAKGLDLPFVTLVGVVLADVGLNFPDYRATERTFQLLMQVAGRAGRSVLGGRVVLQTFQPWHYVIQKAARHDFEGFYQQELEYRRQLDYPPFAELVRLEYRHLKWDQAVKAANEQAELAGRWLKEQSVQDIELIGPAPAFFSRVNGYFRWQLLLRGQDLKRIISQLPLKDWKVEVDPPDIL